MTFDPFGTTPPMPPAGSPIPAPVNPSVSNPFPSADEDEDEIHFDLTGEGNVSPTQPSAAIAEPELRVELAPTTPPAGEMAPSPAFTAPWEMPSPSAPAPEAANPFSLDLSAPPTPAPQTAPPATSAGAGLVSLFDRLVNMIEEETRAFEASQKKHQANIANEQRLMEEETRDFGRKKSDILKGLEELKRRLSS